MLKKRDAQGLSITTIIIAVIALVIIIVLIAILTGKLGDFGSGLKSFGDASKTCSSQGTGSGVATELMDECEGGETAILSSDGPGQGKKCCKTVSSTTTTPTTGCGGAGNAVCKVNCIGSTLNHPAGNKECKERNPLKSKCCIP